MAPRDEAAVERRARRAYELGRARMAVARAWPVPFLVALSMLGCSEPAVTIGAGAALAACVASFAWRGGMWARAASSGLAAGAVPFVLPLLSQQAGRGLPMATLASFCLGSTFAGGMVAGALVARAAARETVARATFLGAAILVAGLTGALGCAVAGTMGLLGMGVGLVLATGPALVQANRA